MTQFHSFVCSSVRSTFLRACECVFACELFFWHCIQDYRRSCWFAPESDHRHHVSLALLSLSIVDRWYHVHASHTSSFWHAQIYLHFSNCVDSFAHISTNQVTHIDDVVCFAKEITVALPLSLFRSLCMRVYRQSKLIFSQTGALGNCKSFAQKAIEHAKGILWLCVLREAEPLSADRGD